MARRKRSNVNIKQREADADGRDRFHQRPNRFHRPIIRIAFQNCGLLLR